MRREESTTLIGADTFLQILSILSYARFI